MLPLSWARELLNDALRFGSSVAAVDEAKSLTYVERAANACGLAYRLIDEGVAQGTPVACCLQNCVEVVWVAAGISAAGAAEMVLDPSLSDDDLLYACRLAGVNVVVTSDTFVPRFEKMGLKTLQIGSVASKPFRELAKLPEIDPSGWGKLLITSGTTGRPKGVVHSHERRWVATLMLRAHLPFTPGRDDRILLMTSFAHGSSQLTAAFLQAGASVYLARGVDPVAVADLLDRQVVNCLFAPPTVLAKITSKLSGRRFDKVRCVFTGTAALMPELYVAASKMFGPTIRITYGMTEIFNPIATLQPTDADRWYEGELAGQPGSCLGTPAAGVSIVIVDDTGEELAAGEIGEVLIRAPQMFLGYLEPSGFKPCSTFGFHSTGDLGYVDAEGRVYLTGRMRDVIKTGGYKIFPEEIERSLGAGSVVLGYPSAYWGEIVVAVVEDGTTSTWPPSEESLHAVTGYKKPRAYLRVDTFPRNGQGKVVRSKLRELISSTYRMEDGPYPRFVSASDVT